MTPALYTASVPVFRHYLDRAHGMVSGLQGGAEALDQRLAPDMFTCADQFSTAAGFAVRVAFPLAGQEVPDFPSFGAGQGGVLKRIDFARDALAGLEPQAFEGAEVRRIAHRAGFAELEQRGDQFLHLFGMPNFMFHLSMGFAILRQAGVGLGKADFDGQHDYPPGFSF